MSISRPLLIMPGTKRSRHPMQVPAAARGASGDGTAWYFVEPVKATTAGAAWTLSANKAALLWDGGPTTATALDLGGHAYMIFALENADQLYAVVQEDWASVVSPSVICPIAWVDAHLDLTPRLLGSTITFVMQTSDGSLYTYGAAPGGALPYPAGATGVGLVGSAFPTVTDMRLATRGSSVMVLLNNGNLAYLATAGAPATSTLVTLPRFSATDVIPRVLGINADPVAGIWYALVEYDPGVATYRGLVVLQASTVAATNDTDWSIAYTILDMTVAPSSTPATPGMDVADASTFSIGGPLSPVSWTFLFDERAGGFGTGFNLFHTGIDFSTGLLNNIFVSGPVTVYFAAGATATFGSQIVGFPGPVTPGTYYLYATLGLGFFLGTSVPSGSAAIMTVTVTGRISDTYTPVQGVTGGTLSDDITLSNPQTLPSSHSMTMEASGLETHSGMFITFDPSKPVQENATAAYAGNTIGFRTDDVSFSLSSDWSDPLYANQIQISVLADQTAPGFFNGSTTWDSLPTACVQAPTGSSVPSSFTVVAGVTVQVGPTVSATPIIGAATPPPPPVVQALGIGPQGETLVNAGTGWSYWAPGISPRSSAFSDVVTGTFISRFGSGTPSPICIDFEMIDGTGALDTNPLRQACYDAPNNVYYGVFSDGDLRQRIGAVPAAWTILSVSFVPTPSFTPMALRLRGDILQCIYGAGNQVFLVTYNRATGAVTRAAPVPFPVYEHNGPGSMFGVAAFLN